jgi:hypothetical protein
MTDTENKVTFEQARNVASQAAKSELGQFAPVNMTDVLSDFYMEAEGCWFFFGSDEIVIPKDKGIVASGVYAVTRTGALSYVYDFRENEEQMRAYLEMFSLYSLGRREEAHAAWSAFKEKYNLG